MALYDIVVQWKWRRCAMKKSFWALCRYMDADGKIIAGYLKKEGTDVPNRFGFDLAVYKTVDTSQSDENKKVKVWIVVDTRSGLSIAQGNTKKAAIDAAMQRLLELDMSVYYEKLKKVVEQYGECPGHRITWLH